MNEADVFIPVILLVVVFFTAIFFSRKRRKSAPCVFGNPFLTTMITCGNFSFSVGIFRSHREATFADMFQFPIFRKAKDALPLDIVDGFLMENKETIIEEMTTHEAKGLFALVGNLGGKKLTVLKITATQKDNLQKQELSPLLPHRWPKGSLILRVLAIRK